MRGRRKKMKIIIKMNIVLTFIVTAFLCIWCASCDLGSKDTDIAFSGSKGSFSKIYNNSDQADYTPLDIKPTNDAYIILGMVDEHPYLLKVNEEGNFLWDTTLPEYTYPIPELQIQTSKENTPYYYFVCNKPVEAWKVQVLSVEVNNKGEVTNSPAIIYNYLKDLSFSPIHASINSKDNYLLMSGNSFWGDVLFFSGIENNVWDRTTFWPPYEGNCRESYPLSDRRFHYSGIIKGNDYFAHTWPERQYYYLLKKSPICLMITMMVIENNKGFPIGFFVENPFLALEWDASGQSNANLTPPLDPPWKSLKLSGAYLKNDVIYFVINYDVEEKVNEINDTLSFPDSNSEKRQDELDELKPVFIKSMKVNGEKIAFFAGTTRKNQIVLYAYDYNYNEGDFLNKRYFGETRIYEAAGLIETGDNGLAILGSTYIVDQFKRICLIKLSKADLEEMVKGN